MFARASKAVTQVAVVIVGGSLGQPGILELNNMLRRTEVCHKSVQTVKVVMAYTRCSAKDFLELAKSNTMCFGGGAADSSSYELDRLLEGSKAVSEFAKAMEGGVVVAGVVMRTRLGAERCAYSLLHKGEELISYSIHACDPGFRAAPFFGPFQEEVGRFPVSKPC